MTHSIEIHSSSIQKIKLSKREKQNLNFLMQGYSNKTIADELDLSEHTVKVTMWRMFKKIGVKSRLEALNWYVKYSKNSLTQEYEHMDLVARIEKLTRENRMLKSISQASMPEFSQEQIESEYHSAGMMSFSRLQIWKQGCKWAFEQGKLSNSTATQVSKNIVAGNDASVKTLPKAA
jgi:DNA-binding CsgD family transcriptional regulator